MKIVFSVFTIIVLCAVTTMAQEYDIISFDYTSDGPWNDPELTDISIPKVPNGTVTLDGAVSASEYGGFQSMEIIPMETGWPLNWPGEREWSGPDDSKFTFYIAHDDDYIYLGFDVTDDVLSQDAETSAAFWQDDCVEVVLLPTALYYPDTWGVPAGYNGQAFEYGIHTYFTYNEKMRGIEPDGTDSVEQIFTASDWTFGEEIQSKGSQSATGWIIEAKILKSLFLAKDIELPWYDTEGQTYDFDFATHPMSFVFGIDDDDANPLYAERTGFECQYWWPVTRMLSSEWGNFGDDLYTWSQEEIANGAHAEFYETIPGTNLNIGSLGTMHFEQEITAVNYWSIY
jgi:hypothetical protein